MAHGDPLPAMYWNNSYPGNFLAAFHDDGEAAVGKRYGVFLSAFSTEMKQQPRSLNAYVTVFHGGEAETNRFPSRTHRYRRE